MVVELDSRWPVVCCGWAGPATTSAGPPERLSPVDVVREPVVTVGAAATLELDVVVTTGRVKVGVAAAVLVTLAVDGDGSTLVVVLCTNGMVLTVAVEATALEEWAVASDADEVLVAVCSPDAAGAAYSSTPNEASAIIAATRKRTFPAEVMDESPRARAQLRAVAGRQWEAGSRRPS